MGLSPCRCVKKMLGKFGSGKDKFDFVLVPAYANGHLGEVANNIYHRVATAI